MASQISESNSYSPTAASANLLIGSAATTTTGSSSSGAAAAWEMSNQPLKSTDVREDAITELKKLHDEHLARQASYKKEMSQLKLKYYELNKGLYKKRAQVLQERVFDQCPIAEGDATAGSATEAGGAVATTPTATATTTLGTPAIPNFWLTAMKNKAKLEQLIEPHDEPILSYLQDIDYEYLDGSDSLLSFKLNFYFAPNPYFSNTVLSKSFELQEEALSGDAVLVKSVGTAIKWFPSKDVTRAKMNIKQKNKKTGQTRIVQQEVPRETFFRLFESRSVPDTSRVSMMSSSELTELENSLETEYEAATMITEKVIPQAYEWFKGTAFDTDLEEDDEDEDDHGDDEEDEDEDDDDDENEEYDEEDESSQPADGDDEESSDVANEEEDSTSA